MENHYFNGTNGSNGTYLAECSIQIKSEIGLFYKDISHYMSVISTYIIPLIVICISYARLLSYLNKSQKSLVIIINFYFI